MRLKTCRLATQFGTDGPSSPGDQDRPAADLSRVFGPLQADRLAAEQIDQVDIADLRAENLSGQQFAESWDGLARHAGAAAVRDRLTRLNAEREGIATMISSIFVDRML